MALGALAAWMVAEATHTNTWPALLTEDNLYRTLQSDPLPLRKPVLYTHLHKSAGTSMCTLAVLNNESVNDPYFDTNCNTDEDGCNAGLQPDGGVAKTQKTCAERMSEAAATGFSYMGIEKWVDDFSPASCPGLLYATVVREPMSRIVSNTEFARSLGWNATNDEIMTLLQPGTSADTTVGHAPPSRRNASQEMHSGCRHIERSVASFDNFYVRTFGGWDVFSKPAGTLNSDDLEKAKERLAQFSIVIALESFDAQAIQLAGVLGWTKLELPEANVETERDSLPEAQPDVDFTDEQLIQLTKANALDSILYSYAQALGRNLTLNTGASLFPLED